MNIYRYIVINKGLLEALESSDSDPINRVLYHPSKKKWDEWYVLDSDLKVRWNPHFFLEITYKDTKIFYKKVTTIQNAVDIINAYKSKDKDELMKLHDEALKEEKSNLELEVEELKNTKKNLEEKIELFVQIENKRKELSDLVEKLENEEL